jgi:AcrR family transcriptional regulator
MQIADKGGVEALTMRKLADTLGVEAMSLYHHFASKDESLDGMIDVVFGEIDLPAGRTGWRNAMRRRAISAREVLLRHPWAISLLESRSNPGFATLRHHDAVIGSLRKGGFSVAMAAHAFSVLDSYIYGFTMQELNLPFQNTVELEDMAGRIMGQHAAAELPHLTEMIVEYTLKPGYAYGNEFEFGVRGRRRPTLRLDVPARVSAHHPRRARRTLDGGLPHPVLQAAQSPAGGEGLRRRAREAQAPRAQRGLGAGRAGIQEARGRAGGRRRRGGLPGERDAGALVRESLRLLAP